MASSAGWMCPFHQLAWQSLGGSQVSSALLWVGIPALVVLNGLFVAAEFALVVVRRTRVEEMVQQGQKGAKALHTAIEHLDRSIAATQLGVTLASIGLGWLGDPALASLLLP